MCKCNLSRKNFKRIEYELKKIGLYNINPHDAKCYICKRWLGCAKGDGGFYPVKYEKWKYHLSNAYGHMIKQHN